MSQKKTELVFSLLAASSKIERRFDRILSNVRGISFTEYFLLKRLSSQANNAATRVDLAALVHLTPSAVTRALKPLEKIGYVRSKKNERDARQSLATLTTAGSELLSDADSMLSDEIAAMSISTANQKELKALLDGIL